MVDRVVFYPVSSDVFEDKDSTSMRVIVLSISCFCTAIHVCTLCIAFVSLAFCIQAHMAQGQVVP